MMAEPVPVTACPVCAQPDTPGIGNLGHRHLARCPACGHQFVAHHSGVALAEEYRAAYYRDAADPRITEWATAHRAVWDAIVDQILGLHPAATSFLDVGSGSGGFLERLRLRLPSATLAAVEPAAPARDALRVRMPDVTFVADQAEQLGQVAVRFDVITLLQTLEHLHDPLATLRGALQCLNPGGLLFATVPNRRSLAVLRRGRGADCFANGTHLQFFSNKSLFTLMRRAGFRQVTRIVHFGGGQHTALASSLAQYFVRSLCLSTELRVVARAHDLASHGAGS